MHAAALRFTRAILTVTGFQYPLTEENLIDKLKLWALGPLDDEGNGGGGSGGGGGGSGGNGGGSGGGGNGGGSGGGGNDASSDAAADDDDADDGLGGGAAAAAARSAAAAAAAAAAGPTAALAAAVRAAAEAMRVTTYATACLAVVGLYKLSSVYPQLLTAPGFNPRAYEVNTWFQSLLSNATCAATLWRWRRRTWRPPWCGAASCVKC
jgi:hypothetical protein